MCPHITIYVPSYYYIFGRLIDVSHVPEEEAELNVFQLCVVLLYVCPHTTTYKEEEDGLV